MSRYSRISLLILSLSFCVPPVFADYAVGQRIEWRNPYSRYGDKWMRGTVTRDSGAGNVERYLVKVDGGVGEEHAREHELRPESAAPPQAPPGQAPGNPAINVPVNPPQAPVRNQPVNPPVQPPRQAPPMRAPVNNLPKGKFNGWFRNGEKLGTPGQANYKIDKDGVKRLVVVANPGDSSFIGKWDLGVGGIFSLKGRQTQWDGSQLTMWDFGMPAKADVLIIRADGTWFKQFNKKQASGRWMNLGQNVVQIIGFEEDDWTGSVKAGRLTIKSPSGQWEEGKRF